MSEIKIPPVGESITSGLLAAWLVEDGAYVNRGDALFSLETDKISNEIPADEDGVIKILIQEGEEVAIGTVVGEIDSSAPAPEKEAAPAEAEPAKEEAKPAPESEPAKKAAPTPKPKKEKKAVAPVDPATRVTRKKMSPLRKKIANHLVSAQQNAALLTTFNEVDMSAVMTLRKSVQESFVEKYGVKLGFMSLFAKAVVFALKEVPQVNTQIDGDDLVQNHFYDIGVAVGTDKGLVVPVIRDCDQKSFAEIEQDIAECAGKARDGKLELSDLQGGVFTISNGGIYGSMLSTPILNPPQSGILGMHNIQQRAVVVDGEIVARPMMYLALSYDHRVIDGKEAVTFLIRIKESLENPARLLAQG